MADESHPNPQYAGIPAWVVYFALDSRYDPREVWPAIQALGEEKAKKASIGGKRLTLGRADQGKGQIRIGILTHCPRCKRAFEEE